MIKKMAVVVAAAAGLVIANASWAVAGSDGHGGGAGHSKKSGVACVVGHDAGGSNICGNTYVYSPNILGGLLDLIVPPPTTGDGGGGGNNGGGNGGGGNN